MPKSLFTDYEGFVDKFKPKLTTDDCYTPQWCYDMVLEYVDTNIRPLEGLNVVRPFWPGGDYENYGYAPNDVVIDNPPFSIISKICAFYHHRGIPYFLFAPSLTLGCLAKDLYTAIICGVEVTYANGAKVNTSFVSNMVQGNPAIIVDGQLSRRLREGDKKARKTAVRELPVYELPDGVVTAARLQKIAHAGVSLRIERREARFVRALESQRAAKKALFGGGWILSREAAAREAAAREAAASVAAAREAAAREAAAREAAAREVRYWPLSTQERALMDSLGKD